MPDVGCRAPWFLDRRTMPGIFPWHQILLMWRGNKSCQKVFESRILQDQIHTVCVCLSYPINKNKGPKGCADNLISRSVIPFIKPPLGISVLFSPPLFMNNALSQRLKNRCANNARVIQAAASQGRDEIKIKVTSIIFYFFFFVLVVINGNNATGGTTNFCLNSFSQRFSHSATQVP